MKKGCVSLFLVFAAFFSRAQELPVVRIVENTNEEVFEMLRMLGAEGFRFDLSAFTADGDYVFAPYLEEYAGGVKQEGSGIQFGSQPNWRQIPSDDEFDSSEDRQEWLVDKTLSADGEKYLNFEDIGLFIVPQSDSTSQLGFNFYGAMSGGFPPLKLRPLENLDFAGDRSGYTYLYDIRPFKIRFSAEQKQRVPLLLYGSFWWDEKNRIHRFCGESEIEPDLSSEILESIPHYYVVGIEVEKME
jgi:hypothetical protein